MWPAILVPMLAALLPAVHSLRSTDFPRDGDVPQSGYSTVNNFDPANLSKFKINWKATFNTGEYFYAKPLIFTPSNAASERIYTASNQNWLRVLDSTTGAVLLSRQLPPPFQASDTECGDIMNTVGIIGTPIIDPATELMYFWSKSYKGGAVGPFGEDGVMKGEAMFFCWTSMHHSITDTAILYVGDMKLYAVKLSDLTDAPGFPISIDGMSAYNDPARYLIAGTMNQRPGLTMLGDSIISGFGSHCMNFNYTGFLVTASKTAGVGITDIQAMVAPPGNTSS
jgi:hypothetical protein